MCPTFFYKKIFRIELDSDRDARFLIDRMRATKKKYRKHPIDNETDSLSVSSQRLFPTRDDGNFGHDLSTPSRIGTAPDRRVMHTTSLSCVSASMESEDLGYTSSNRIAGRIRFGRSRSETGRVLASSSTTRTSCGPLLRKK